MKESFQVEETIHEEQPKQSLNPVKRIKEKLLSEFKEHVLSWKDDERITEEDANLILTALDDPEVQIYLDLFVQQNILTTFVLRTEVCAALGVILTGEAQGALISELIRMAIRNLHIQIAGAGLPFSDRQKAAFGGMLFAIGGEMPLILLYQLLKSRYPELYKYFRIYLSNRKFYNIVSRQRDGQTPFTKNESKYLSKIFPRENVTPENLIEAERSRFNQLLEEFNV